MGTTSQSLFLPLLLSLFIDSLPPTKVVQRWIEMILTLTAALRAHAAVSPSGKITVALERNINQVVEKEKDGRRRREEMGDDVPGSAVK